MWVGSKRGGNNSMRKPRNEVLAMNMIFGKAKQRGVVIVQTVLALTAMLGMAALALDLGNAYLNKTRLQNALDAAALAAAKTLDQLQLTTEATAEAHNVFGLNANTNGNYALRDAWSSNAITLTLEYSATLNPFTSGSTTGPYVRARATGFQLSSWFARIFGITSLQVTGSAVAGPSAPLTTVCDVAPVVICEGTQSGPYGRIYGEVYDLTIPNNNSEIGPGNFQLLDFGTGADTVRDALAGNYSQCLNINDQVTSQPGGEVGPVSQGIETRFDTSCPNNLSETECANYPIQPDKVSTQGISYSQYETKYTNEDFDHPDGIAGRRILKIPVANCPGVGAGGGKETLTVIGVACFFLRDEPNNGNLKGEFIGACNAQGVPGGGSGTGPLQYEIVLHDDPNSPDS
jgi:hypothetical protein